MTILVYNIYLFVFVFIIVLLIEPIYTRSALWIKQNCYYSFANNFERLIEASFFYLVLAAASFYMNSYLEVSDSYVLFSVLPVKIYVNTDIKKLEILKENTGRSGIYRWINNTDGKSYIGSSTKLNKRFLQYFNTKFLLNKTLINKSLIYNSLLKNGYSNFSRLRR